MASYAQAKAIQRIKKIWYKTEISIEQAMRWSKRTASGFIGKHSHLSYSALKERENISDGERTGVFPEGF